MRTYKHILRVCILYVCIFTSNVYAHGARRMRSRLVRILRVVYTHIRVRALNIIAIAQQRDNITKIRSKARTIVIHYYYYYAGLEVQEAPYRQHLAINLAGRVRNRIENYHINCAYKIKRSVLRACIMRYNIISRVVGPRFCLKSNNGRGRSTAHNCTTIWRIRRYTVFRDKLRFKSRRYITLGTECAQK